MSWWTRRQNGLDSTAYVRTTKGGMHDEREECSRPRLAAGLLASHKIGTLVQMKTFVASVCLLLVATGLRAGTLVRFHTALGDMTFELLDQAAPLTTSNFLAHLRAGDYADGIIDQIRPQAEAYVASGGWLGITNRGTANADFAEKKSDSILPNESYLSTAVPNSAGTLAMVPQGISSYDTNGTLLLATNSDPLRFVINLTTNMLLDTKAILIGTNGINLPVYPTNFYTFDTLHPGDCIYKTNFVVRTNCVLQTNCTAITNCIVSTNCTTVTNEVIIPVSCTVVTNTYQKIPNYTVFGRLVDGSPVLTRLKGFVFVRNPETNILLQGLTLPPPVASTILDFPLLQVNRSAIENGTFDFSQVVHLDIVTNATPQAKLVRQTNGLDQITWIGFDSATNSVQYATNFPGAQRGTSGIRWQTLTNLVRPPPGTNSVETVGAKGSRFYRIVFE